MCQIERMASSNFNARSVKYEDVNNLFSLFDGLFMNTATPKPLVLVGAKGIGKSLSFAAYAEERKIPLITFDCSEDVRRSHLLGQFVLRGNDTPFVLGPIPTAFEVANEVGQAILVLEEVNALTPQCQKILNGITDFRRRVEVPEAKKAFELREGAKLWICGSMNTAVYSGVYSLNEDLKSRLRLMNLSYPQPNEERRIIAKVMNGSPPTAALVDQVLTLAQETRQNSYEYALSTRDVVQLLEDLGTLPEKTALSLILGKFEGEDRITMIQRIQSNFGVKCS